MFNFIFIFIWVGISETFYMLMQATAGLRALEGDAPDRILQAVNITCCILLMFNIISM